MSEYKLKYTGDDESRYKGEVVYSDEKAKEKPRYFVNIILFIATFVTTTFAGVAWLQKDPTQLLNFSLGITYSVLIMLVITTHEFGHYFAARIHKVPVTLPYYIPFPFLDLNPFGTMGAVIRMKAHRYTRKGLFDIGASGPIAGWITCLIILIIGFKSLPGIEYLYNIHPEIAINGLSDKGFHFGENFMFSFIGKVFAPEGSFIPPMNEVYHYPFLCVGWFGLLITSLNLMPIGQLDGGHIIYCMFPKYYKTVARIFFVLLLLFGLIGVFPVLEYYDVLKTSGMSPVTDWLLQFGSISWLIWAILILWVIKIEHPDTVENKTEELDTGRMLLGFLCIVIFITSFTPRLAYDIK
ncbi:MAG: site-2 protease family protein [Ignavibacteriae bacterium]|nr:site-2 protease family protein [Ignavibacteriota bacterium]MCB9244332.1 site-2 protease family protein [Ignavibacteriales bacterium]